MTMPPSDLTETKLRRISQRLKKLFSLPLLVPGAANPGDRHHRALWGLLPALLVLATGVGTLYWYHPLQHTTGTTRLGTTLPAGDVMVVQVQRAAGYRLLQGNLQHASATTITAPRTALVARVLATPGQQVAAGQCLLQLSTGPQQQHATATEREHDRAAAEQVAVVTHQARPMQHRLESADQQLHTAQARYQAAQEKIADTRAMLTDLKNGIRPGAAREGDAAESQRDRLMRAREAVKSATSNLNAQRQKLAAAEQSADQSRQKLQDAQQQETAVFAKFEARTASGSDVEAARAAVTDAQQAAGEATLNVSRARQELDQSEAALASLKKIASSIAARNGNPDAHPATPSPAPALSTQDLEMATRMVRDATAESRQAAADIARLQHEIGLYRSEVGTTTHHLERASGRLKNAEDRIAIHDVQVGMRSILAPRSGTLQWITATAEVVGRGDPVVKLVQEDPLQVRLEDYSQAWTTMRTGDSVYVLVASRSAVPATGTMAPPAPVRNSPAGHPAVTPPAPTATPPIPQDTVPEMPGDKTVVPTTACARLTRVQSPQGPGQPAILTAEIPNPLLPDGHSRQFLPGATVWCSALEPGNRDVMSIPLSALQGDEAGQLKVAVLVTESPASEQIQWRPVTVGPSDGIQVEIKSGLQAGDRIVLRPQHLASASLPHQAPQFSYT